MEENRTDISQVIHLQSVLLKDTNNDRWMEHLLAQMILLREIQRIWISLFDNNSKQLYFDGMCNGDVIKL
jgi:hypothetical protein